MKQPLSLDPLAAGILGIYVRLRYGKELRAVRPPTEVDGEQGLGYNLRPLETAPVCCSVEALHHHAALQRALPQAKIRTGWCPVAGKPHDEREGHAVLYYIELYATDPHCSVPFRMAHSLIVDGAIFHASAGYVVRERQIARVRDHFQTELARRGFAAALTGN
jgi:hypothetical protein